MSSTLGDNIRAARRRNGISAIELARRAQLSKGYLSELENGKATRPSAVTVFRLAASLNCTPDELMAVQSVPVVACWHGSIQWVRAEIGMTIECMTCGQRFTTTEES